MSTKTTPEEFCAKMEAEGIDYAFIYYGLSHEDLDREEDPEFYDLVKHVEENMKNLNPEREQIINKMDALTEEDLEDLEEEPAVLIPYSALCDCGRIGENPFRAWRGKREYHETWGQGQQGIKSVYP